MKKALVTGISGQDGAYLAKLLLQNGYDVCGTSRDAQISSFRNLDRVGIRKDVQLASVALNDFRSVLQVLFKVQPDEIYNLAGQSSVSLSFEQPVETQDSIYLGTLNLLEAIRFTGRAIKLYNASSSECFGDLGDSRPPKRRLSGRAVRTPWRNLRPSGRYPITGRPTTFLRVPASCLITSRHCVPNDSLLRRLSGLPVVSPKATKRNFSWAILRFRGIGAGLPNTSKQCIGCFNRSHRKILLLQRAKPGSCKILWRRLSTR